MNHINWGENGQLVMAIDPAPRGFGYVLFEGPKTPLDWGITEARVQTNKRSLARIKKMIDAYRPDVLVLENSSSPNSHRCLRVQNLINQIIHLAKSENIPIRRYSRGRIKKVFAQFGAKNKDEAARLIAEWLPVLAPRVPPKRKIWMSEDQRINIFDAASLALVYYYEER